MSKNNNIIEINGNHYDAVTGQSLTKDGHATPAKTNTKAAEHTAAKPRPAHKAAAKVSAHHPEAAKTLMRHSVKKPASLKRTLKAHGGGGRLARQPKLALQPKLSAAQIDARRLRHAKTVKPSKLVNRFRPHTGSTYVGEPVVMSSSPSSINGLTNSLAAPTSSTSQLLERALHRATSHLQPAHHPAKRSRRPSRRITSISAVSLTVLLLAGFVTYQNIANIKLHEAASKAGFAANLPGYRPAGFSLGHFNYSPGVVAIHFHSNSDARSYALTEKPSDWDAQALVDQFLDPSAQGYQTAQQGSQTIYLYGQANATWVSHGVWYQLQTNGALSNGQLLQLAGSV